MAVSETRSSLITREPIMATTTITFEIDDADATQLAQFCKRSTYSTFYEYTEPHLPDHDRAERAYQMRDGIDRVRRALANAGFAPR
ncbi:hypothetical protein HHL21_14410 [Massilia sp. RP-1-19]|uniref:Uncharacterized protein n=1 Tax=Massilia polaris TaxID=2728846 RepID=A0A848HK68_9BURK|nr:hypothetical protein [Massilia polaris]NML62246.1 hypothetical protein [Massilia polaris]